MKNSLLLSGLILLACISCNPMEKTAFSTDLWLNGYFNESFLYTYPTLYDYTYEDTLLIYNLRADTVFAKRPYTFTDSTLVQDTTVFQLLENSESRRVAQYNPREGDNRVSFAVREIQLKNYDNVEAIKAALMERAWEKTYQPAQESFSFKEVWTFEADQLVKTTYYTLDDQTVYAEKEYHCWTVTAYKGYFFLTWYGHRDDCDTPLAISEQILQLDEQQFTISNSFGPTLDEQTLTTTTARNYPSQDYKVCYHHINQYYYRPHDNGRRVRYDGGLRVILATAKTKYVVPENAVGQTGWVRIRFVINCEGQLGRFRIQEIDEDIQPTQFDPRIVAQLFKIVRELDGYQPRSTADGTTLDDYKHITFKLKDGQIIELLP